MLASIDPLHSMASDGALSTYEQERQARIATNKARMEAIGVGMASHRPLHEPQHT